VGVWLGIELNRIREKARAVSMLEALGAYVTYDYQWSESGAYVSDAEPPGQQWLKDVLGSHYRANVVELHLFAKRGKTPEKLTDENAHLLSALTELDWLVLMDTNITDAALEHFTGLKKLTRLDLEGTRVTTNGVQKLCDALPRIAVFYGSHGEAQMTPGANWQPGSP
jgi:hypothetical protein